MPLPYPMLLTLVIALLLAPAGAAPAGAEEGAATPVPSALVPEVAPGIFLEDDVYFGSTYALPPTPIAVRLQRVRIAPGATHAFTTTEAGLSLHVVESGALTLRGFTAPVAVLRAAGSPDEIAVGSTGVLGPGDSFTWEPFVAGTLSNEEAVPAVYVAVVLNPAAYAPPAAGTPRPESGSP
jgi:hypothetical protein